MQLIDIRPLIIKDYRIQRCLVFQLLIQQSENEYRTFRTKFNRFL